MPASPPGASIGLSWASVLLILLVPFIFFFGKLPGPVEAQNCTGDSPCGPTVHASSRSPGARASYEVTFVTPVEIGALTDSIVMELHQDIKVPGSIAPARVRVRYRKGSDTARGPASDVSLSDQDNSRRPTRVNLAHGIRKDGSQAAIPAGAEVTVTFAQGAGIGNPAQGGPFSWQVGLGNDGRLVDAHHPESVVREAFRAASPESGDAGLLVDREVRLSREDVTRGQSVTVTARGYRNGYNLAVWRDGNIDGRRDSGERVLCETVVGSNGTGRCSFTVNVPPFVGAFGECAAATALDCNLINGEDSRSGSSVITGRGSARIYDAGQVLHLVGAVRANTVQGPGGRIELELIDFPAGEITAVNIGGTPAITDRQSVGTSGRLSFSVSVPDGVRLGRQYLRVDLVRRDNGETFSGEVIVDITQPSTVVRIFPETVQANQRVAISGMGFSEVDGASIKEVELGGHAVGADRINGGEGKIEVAEDGSWSGFLDLPVIEGATAPGTHVLRVRDSQGRTGSVEVTVPPRELTVTPAWGRPGTLVTVSGSGFPSRNDHGSTVVIRIFYDTADGFTLISTETDIDGNFSRAMRIPLRTATPSSNQVRVEFDDDNGVKVATTARHEVPAATVRLDPAQGPPGTPITMTGSGFRHHVPIASVMFGHLDIAAGRLAATDAQGEFTLNLVAPGLGAGRHTVQAAVAGVTASAAFDLKPSGVVPGAPLPAREALASLGGRLLRVFHFNNDTKRWTFYEPDLHQSDVPDGMALDFIVAGETYLILVSETTYGVLNGRPRSLTCLQGNCWNALVLQLHY